MHSLKAAMTGEPQSRADVVSTPHSHIYLPPCTLKGEGLCLLPMCCSLASLETKCEDKLPCFCRREDEAGRRRRQCLGHPCAQGGGVADAL